jgi:hypothetical protein
VTEDSQTESIPEVVTEPKKETKKNAAAKKPKAKKEITTTSETEVVDKKVAKKTKAKKESLESPEALPEKTSEERPVTPVLEDNEEGLPDLGSRVSDELEEEELSDIED